MSEFSKKGTVEYALADVLSRPNMLNGLYQKLRFPLMWEHLRKKDASYITHVANLADKIIAEAISNGRDLNNPNVKEELQIAFHGGSVGASLAIKHHKFLRFLGFRK